MITLIPVGGLANRMRTIASALALSRHCACTLRIVWIKDPGLNCRFDQLFQLPASFPEVEVIEAKRRDVWCYDRPRRRNLYLPLVIQKMKFDACLYEAEVIQKRDAHFDFADWVEQHQEVYIASYIAFWPYESSLLQSFFQPISSIQSCVNKIAGHFNRHTQGVHIRRTDNVHSIQLSPLTLFIERLEAEIARDPAANFYLASDSPEDKALLVKHFGERICTHHFSAQRNCPEGIQDAWTELLVLSHTCQIIGSCWSSFSEIAAQLSDIPCIILKK